MTVHKLIGLLQESMPGERIEVVELDEMTRDPLQEVAERLDEGQTNPVMIVGLEKAVPSSDPTHPVLHLLNLQRPEWRKRIPRPMVLWIPEYLLSLLGVEAPDFLDWRSDTLFFPSDEPMLELLASDVWLGGLDGHMPAELRSARVEELRSRLVALAASTDRPVLAARSAWLMELGNHLLVFGDFEEAEAAYREVLRIEEHLKRPANVGAVYNNLGNLALLRRRLSAAAELFEKSIAIAREGGDREGLGIGYANLASVSIDQQNFARAEELMKMALELRENPTSRELAMVYSRSALAHLRQDRIEEAEKVLKEALRLNQEAGDHKNLAADLRLLAEIFYKRGDYKGAARSAKKALVIDEKLLNRDGLARDLTLIGVIDRGLGHPRRARRSLERALDLFQTLGNDTATAALRRIIDRYPSVPQ